MSWLHSSVLSDSFTIPLSGVARVCYPFIYCFSYTLSLRHNPHYLQLEERFILAHMSFWIKVAQSQDGIAEGLSQRKLLTSWWPGREC